MIYIITKNSDESSNEVCEYLNYFNEKFTRINVDHFQVDFNLDLSIGSINKNSFFGCNENKGIIWYRRPTLDLSDINIYINDEKQKCKNYVSELIYNKRKEYEVLFDYMNIKTSCKKLGDFKKTEMNKLLVLDYAQKSGLDIPNTIVLNSKKDLLEFKKRSETGIISKSIYEVIFSVDEISKSAFMSYTYQVDNKIIDSLPETFAPSLAQVNIPKLFEIRSFYLDGEIFSMAIFSQINKRTKIDFRHYDLDNPTRKIPYKLPSGEENKIRKLMNSIDLNCGSIDLIKGINNKYYFLEVNPVGQFGMVSIPCNYNLEKKIAKYLISKNE